MAAKSNAISGLAEVDYVEPATREQYETAASHLYDTAARKGALTELDTILDMIGYYDSHRASS